MKFSIFNHTIEVSDNEIYSHNMFQLFMERAHRASKEFYSKYKGYQTWGKFIASGPADGYKIICFEIEYAARLLVKEGNYGMSADILLERYGDRIMEPWTRLIDELADLLDSVKGMEEQAEYARELRKASRGQIIGGGFGISGAIKGIAFAGAANLVTGSMHSFANAIGNAHTRHEIAKQEAKLYESEEFTNAVCSCVYGAVVNVVPCLLIEHGVTDNEVNPRDSRMAENYMRNYPLIPKEDRCAVLLKALYCDVYNTQVYEHLLQESDDSADIIKMGHLFGLDAELKDISIQVLNKMVPEPNKLSSMNKERKIQLLELYRKKKAALGVRSKLESEKNIETELIKDIAPTNWEKTDAIKIPALIDHISEEKKRLGLTVTSNIETTLSQKLLDAKTVNNVVYDSVEEARNAQQERERILALCKDMDTMNYEGLTALKTKIYSNSIIEPEKCAKDTIAQLERHIAQKERELRTYNGILYKSADDIKKAKELRESASILMSKCDFSSAECVVTLRERLLEIDKQISPSCVSDYLKQINDTYKKFCTYRGRVFQTIEEKQVVERDYEELSEAYSLNSDILSAKEISQIRSLISCDLKVHPLAKELLDCQCRKLLDDIAANERDKYIRDTTEELAKRFGTIDINSRTHGNYDRLKNARNELKKYEPECTRALLPPIEQAISECEELYGKESDLEIIMKHEKESGSVIKLLLRIVMAFIISSAIAFAGILFLSGWLMLVVTGGAIIYFVYHVFDGIRNCIERKKYAREIRIQLKEIQSIINK